MSMFERRRCSTAWCIVSASGIVLRKASKYASSSSSAVRSSRLRVAVRRSACRSGAPSHCCSTCGWACNVRHCCDVGKVARELVVDGFRCRIAGLGGAWRGEEVRGRRGLKGAHPCPAVGADDQRRGSSRSTNRKPSAVAWSPPTTSAQPRPGKMSLLDRMPLPAAVTDTIHSLNLTNPLNVVLLLLTVYLLASLVPASPSLPSPATLGSNPQEYNWRPKEHPPALVWRTWRPEELRGYDGTRHDGEEKGRIMFAIRRKVYDVTSGRSFYGPGARATQAPVPSASVGKLTGGDACRGTIRHLRRPGRLEEIGRAHV